MNAFFIVLVVSLFLLLSPILMSCKASAVAAGLYLVSRKINYLIVIFFWAYYLLARKHVWTGKVLGFCICNVFSIRVLFIHFIFQRG